MRTLLVWLLAAPLLAATTYHVGPDQPLKRIAEAAARVRPGDTVVIHEGVYHEAIVWRGGSLKGPPITIRGRGKAVIDGTGVRVDGKGTTARALFQVQGANFVFEDLDLRNARNGRNAAGFRLLNARRTTIRRCRVTYCDMGFMSTNNDDLLVEHSEIAFNGTPSYNGYSHNFYLGGDHTTIRYNYIHDSTNGQNFKTRGRYVELLYNYIADAHDRIDGGDTTKEIGIQESEGTELPNSHALLLGNIIIKRGAGYSFLDFGPEREKPIRNGTLYLINNTLVRESTSAGWLLRLGHEFGRAVLYNNIIYGISELARGPGAALIEGSNNWLPAGVAVPPGLKESIQGIQPGFVSLPQRDYRLQKESPCRQKGAEGLSALDAQGASRPVAATEEYATPMNRTVRPSRQRISIGALEAPMAY